MKMLVALFVWNTYHGKAGKQTRTGHISGRKKSKHDCN